MGRRVESVIVGGNEVLIVGDEDSVDKCVDAIKGRYPNYILDSVCLAVFERIKKAGMLGATEREISRSVGAFRVLPSDQRKWVLSALADTYGLVCRNRNEHTKGRPALAWFY